MDYLNKMKEVIEKYFKKEDSLKAEIKRIEDKYSNLIDKTGLSEEVAAVETKIAAANKKAIEDIRNIVSEGEAALREWGRPTGEKIKDIGILQLDLTENEIIDLLDYHKDNPVMIKELQSYAKNKGYNKAAYTGYETAETKIEKLKEIEGYIVRGLEVEDGYLRAYIKNSEALNKLLGL